MKGGIEMKEMKGKNTIVKDGILYWLSLGEDNFKKITLKIIDESDKQDTHMSWLKERLLNINSSFDQRLWGFTKMSQYAELVIFGNPGYKLSKDKNGEYVIIRQ